MPRIVSPGGCKLAEDSYPADNVDYDSGQYRSINARFGDGITDDRTDTTKSYPLPSPLPSSGSTLTLGQGKSVVQGFGHTVPSGGQAVTIPAASGGTQVFTIVVRYDPTRTIPNPDYDSGDPNSPATLGVPCQLAVLSGTAGGPAKALTQNPAGVWEFPLWDVTRTVGETLAGAAYKDRRVWSSGGLSAYGYSTPGATGAPSAGLLCQPLWVPVTTATNGRATVPLPRPFPNGFHSATVAAVQTTSTIPPDVRLYTVTPPTKADFTIQASALAARTFTLSGAAWGW
jgi:hypothetical protein